MRQERALRDALFFAFFTAFDANMLSPSLIAHFARADLRRAIQQPSSMTVEQA
jgi:hypothetical protein